MKKRNEKIERVGLIANSDKVESIKVIRGAARFFQRRGIAIAGCEQTASMTGLDIRTEESSAKLARECDLLLVFGGDGTMLRVTREITPSRTPVLAINVGSLGFLTAVPSQALLEALEDVCQGRYTIDARRLIEATCHVRDTVRIQHAMNDFVITRGAASRMIELEVSVDDEELTRFRCDGLIVSSPTGSTAYSLSAGGAIVSPNAKVFEITPICPHTLSNRSVIVSLSSVVKVRVLNEEPETLLASDGQVETRLHADAEVVIRRSRRAVRLVRLEGSTFFKTLRQKLNWSGSSV